MKEVGRRKERSTKNTRSIGRSTKRKREIKKNTARKRTSRRRNIARKSMSQFKNMFNSMRFKRAAGDNLDLGDRPVEKLAEQKHQMEAKIGNMTCVMRELNVLDASNNIDIQAMKRDTQKYTMPSEWFKTKYEHLLDTCYEMATNLPAEIAENSVITGETFGTVKLGEVKMFTTCCEKAKTKLCMHQDIKNKVESNFGPMEDILQETQLTEH